jgi:outer membrane protein insertion porin family
LDAGAPSNCLISLLNTASVEVTQRDRPRNRVEVDIDVDEGTSTAISAIEIIGNDAFTDREIKRVFELTEGTILSVFTNDNRYTKEKLRTDLENLESFYKDRGYLQFEISSSQVSISEDLQQLFVTLVLREGKRYKLKDIKISGELPLEREFLESFINIKEDSYYSESLITSYEEFYANALGNDGYTFAEIEGVPTIEDESNVCSIIIFINCGNTFNLCKRIAVVT